MKKIYLSLILVSATLFAFAQNKIDLMSQGLLKQQAFIEQLGENALLKTEKGDKGTIMPFGNDVKRIVVLVDLEDGADISELEAEGAIIRSQIDNLALVEVDYDKVVEFSNLKSIKTLSVPKKQQPKMDNARSKTGVNTVHRPIGGVLPKAYKGAGVVAGLVDAGVTANHPNFINTTDGSTRVKRAYTISGQHGVTIEYDESKMSQFTTDLSTMTHGTHVAGIMAGSYKNLADTVNYYGVATESDIVMVGLGEDTYDNNILLGIEKIIEYAEANNQPAVINMSLGSNSGPHDGSELFSQYLNKLGERGIICVAAGNEGDTGIAITKTCTDSDKNINTFIVPAQSSNGHLGTLEIWSNTNQTFKVTPVIYDLQTNTVAYALPTINTSSNGSLQYIASGQYAASGDITSPVFDNAFSNSYIGFGSNLDKYNNRFTVNFQYYLLFNSENNSLGKNYAFAIMVEGNAGQRLDVYCNTAYSTLSSGGLNGWTDGGGDGSISDMSCAENVISVGSFTTKDKVPVRMEGAGYNYSRYVTLDDISEFSSYGTLIDGRKLPHLTAPGCLIVSSMSPYYMRLALQQGVYDYGEYQLVAKTTYKGTSYYYDLMMGTSMAAPFASGAVALMLQANPELTVDEVRTILMETADKDTYVTTSKVPVQWGAGKINVLNAVKAAVASNGVQNVIADSDAYECVFVTPIGVNQYEVSVVGANEINVALYNMAGQSVSTKSTNGDTLTIDASNVAAGVYVLTVEAEGVKYTTKIVVK